MQRLGLFGGGFDPIHLGHLLVAQAAMEELGLDKLFFIPASVSPFKQQNPPAPAEVRLRWLRLALLGKTNCAIDDQEIRRGGVSYAVETVRHYAETFPRAKLFYLIGADNVPRLKEWRDAAELAARVDFAVVPRAGQIVPDFPEPFHGKALKGFPLEISSSDIRARVKAGLPIEFLVPPFVADAIRDAGAYQK
jgi:nicotinate-nucleotide adenylyltransferase